MNPRTRWIAKVTMFVALLGTALALATTDLGHYLEPQEAGQWLRSLGPWGVVAFVISFAALQPLGFASHAFILIAALVWPPWQAFVLSWIGALGGGCLAFGFARFIAHDWVQSRLPSKMAIYDQRLGTHTFRTVLVLRLMLFTFGPMQLMFGVSRARFWPFLAASAIGIAPVIAAETWLGGSVITWLAG